jgi:hypothetical protein
MGAPVTPVTAHTGKLFQAEKPVQQLSKLLKPTKAHHRKTK